MFALMCSTLRMSTLCRLVLRVPYSLVLLEVLKLSWMKCLSCTPLNKIRMSPFPCLSFEAPMNIVHMFGSVVSVGDVMIIGSSIGSSTRNSDTI